MIKLQPEEHKSLAQYIYSLCAVTLDDSKAYLIESRLAGLVEETGCGSYSGLLLRARTDSAARSIAASSTPLPPMRPFSFGTPRPSICSVTRSLRS